MKDDTLTIALAKERVQQFVDERAWRAFHTPKNLSMAVAVEASELMEIFQWAAEEETQKLIERKRRAIEDEVADVFMDLLCFCNVCDIDLGAAFNTKLEATKKKYPVEKIKGRAIKYTDL